MTTLITAPMDYQRIAEAFVHPIKLRILALMQGRRLRGHPRMAHPSPGGRPTACTSPWASRWAT